MTNLIQTKTRDPRMDLDVTTRVIHRLRERQKNLREHIIQMMAIDDVSLD